MTRPIRLLFVQTQAEMAGAQEISRLLGEALSRVETTDGKPRYEVHHLFFYRRTHAFDAWPNVHFCAEAAPRSPVAFLRFLWRLVRQVRAIRPDVLLAFQHYGNIFGALAGRLARVPLVVGNHVSAPATIGATTRRLDRWMGLAGFYDALTVNSDATWSDYQAYSERYRRLLVHVPHGFQDKTVDVAQADARAEFGLPADAPLMGCVCRLHPLKHIDAALALLADRPTLHLAVAGQGPDEARLKALAAKAGVSQRFHLAGDLPPGRVGRFLAALDVFVFPTLAETFGLAAVEAAQAGIPVVANDLPVLREVLCFDGRPAAVFADASDIRSFGAALDGVLGDPALAASLSAAGRRLRDRYSVEAMAAAYEALIVRGLEPEKVSRGHAAVPDGAPP